MHRWLVLLVLALPALGADLDAALALLRAGRAAEAETALREVVDARPADLPARYWLAVALSRSGRLEEAVEQYRLIVAAKPDSVQSWLGLAQVAERLGWTEEAVDAYRRALAIEPDNRGAAEAVARLTAVAAAAPRMQEHGRASQPPSAPPADEPLGHFVGIATDGLRTPFAGLLRQTELDASAEHVLDYTFGSAPTDWSPTAGTWQMSNRFACDPTWSFFSGQSRGLAMIWNKREFAGDIAVEAYVSFRHGLPFNPQEWSYRPADLCLTICGDGQDPASGYSFIYSGNEGRTTMIRHGSEILASTDEPRYVAPSYTDTRPSTEDFHRRWWRLEARRVGGVLQFWIDGQKALEVPEPEPISAGRVAIWTVRNGMCVARVRICYAGERAAADPPLRVATPAPLPSGDGLAVASAN